MVSGIERQRRGARKSAEIKKEQKRQRIIEYAKNPQKCQFCAGSLLYEKRHYKYCDHSCSASANNVGVTRHGSSRLCQLCGKKTLNKKYCSKECCRKNKREIVHQKIKSGTYKSAWSGNYILRDFLVIERSRGCEECHNKQWLGQDIPLSVHHIDGDASNNIPDNLQLLCLNCHGLTNNFGRKNKNSTRSYRYNR